jgi:pimeloyl-ACP methyl ester carboxylesterase
MQRLAGAGYRAVAPDQRGYSPGARPAGARAYRMSHLVGDALGIADELEMDRFHLVGHDWGAVVGWALAAAHPERVSTWTAMSTPHPRAYLSSIPRSLQLLRSVYTGFFTLPWLPEAVLGAKDATVLSGLLRASGLPRAYAEEYAHAMSDRDALRAALNWYRGARVWDLLSVGRVRVPTLFLWGRHDVALGTSAARATRSWAQGNYRFVPLDAGHWLPETQVERIADLLLPHVARDGAAARVAS